MREIKFRAWNQEDSEMIYLENSGLQYFDFEGRYSLGFTVDGYDGFWGHEQYEGQTEKAKSFPLMQFTGLLDKNGKEIYEGDIFFHDDGNVKVVWDNKMTGYNGEFYDGNIVPLWEITHYGCNFILGNIYENPELLTIE